MKRKIIKQGHNTLTITLPAEWTKRFNLKAGKEIDLIERDNGIFISTDKNSEHKTAEFDITGMDIPTIWKYFMVIYREGYDEIKVKFDPKQLLENPYKYFSQHRYDPRYKKGRDLLIPLEAIQNFVTRFIDFEIIEPGKDYVIVREMGELTSKEFDNCLRRIFLLLEQMTEETLEAIKKDDPSLVSHMHDVDINLDKFHDYCVRILNRVGNKDSRKTSLLFATLYLLEMIGDEFKTISHHMIFDNSKKTFKNLKDLAELIKNQFEVYYDFFYKFDKEKIKTLAKMDETLYLNVGPMYKKASEKEKEIFHHLRMIEKYINALLELRIEMEF
jgi:phosphate uptake regulator